MSQPVGLSAFIKKNIFKTFMISFLKLTWSKIKDGIKHPLKYLCFLYIRNHKMIILKFTRCEVANIISEKQEIVKKTIQVINK